MIVAESWTLVWPWPVFVAADPVQRERDARDLGFGPEMFEWTGLFVLEVDR